MNEQPMYPNPAPAPVPPGKNLAIASLVLGILSLLFICLSAIRGLAYFGLVCGIIGIILAAVAKKQGAKGIATAGLVLSIIAVAICILVIIIAICVVVAAYSALGSLA